MSLAYKPNHCDNCKREQKGKATSFQYLLLYVLLIIGVIPGVLYYFLATPSACYICGLKRRHRKDS